MELFYCPSLNEHSRKVSLSPEESHHAKRVFRKKFGDVIRIINGAGLMASAVVEEISQHDVCCQIQEINKISVPPERNIFIAISTIRPNRMDWAVEKLTELGIGTIQPIFTQHTSVKTFKTEHLQKIAVSAMKQSKQAYLPKLRSPLPFREWLEQNVFQDKQNRLIAHLDEAAKPISGINLNFQKKIILAIGPEGGFSAEEISLSRNYGFQPVKLAHQILRAETAAITAAAQLKMHLL